MAVVEHARDASADGASTQRAPQDITPHSGLFDPGVLMLPYLELSRALLRAHHNALAMVEANRCLTDQLRGIVRRQQDLAFELAEQAWSENREAGGEDREAIFQRAADAVRELGQALIDAQLVALAKLQTRANEDEQPRSAPVPTLR